MSHSLEQILEDAKRWLARRRGSDEGSDERQALLQFGKFLVSISANDAPPKLEAACGMISHWIVDQLDWTSPYCSEISGHIERVRRFAKDDAWRRHKLGSSS